MRAVGDVTPPLTRRIRPRPATVDVEYDTEWTTRYAPDAINDALVGDGAAFDLLDFRRMYKDVAGTQPVTAYGDPVARIDSHDGSSRLITDRGAGAVIENRNGYPVLRFNNNRYRMEGFDPAVERPVIAHGTYGKDSSADVLYWYNRSASGYSGRKWGAFLQPGQYRMFYRDGSIDVFPVESWGPYHRVVLDRAENLVTIDGTSASYDFGDETYASDDRGFRLGGYPGDNAEAYNGYLTHFAISGSSLNADALDAISARHRTLLNI